MSTRVRPPEKVVRKFGHELRIMDISKDVLRIDETYQRTETFSEKRAREIARDFNSVLFQTLVVSLRRSGAHYVLDGQHRLRAVQQIPDIQEVPCSVVDLSHLSEREAQIEETVLYRALNTKRVSPDSYSKHKSGLVIREPVALAVERWIVSTGRRSSPKSRASTVGSIDAVVKCVKHRSKRGLSSVDVLDRIVHFLVSLCEGNTMSGHIIVASFHLELAHCHSTDPRLSLAHPRWIKQARRIGYEKVKEDMTAAYGRDRNDKKAALALGLLLNKGLRSPLFYEMDEDD